MRVNLKTTSSMPPRYAQPPFSRTSQRNTQTDRPDPVASSRQLQTAPADSDSGITEYNQFRSSIATLSTQAVSEFMDYLEWTENKKAVRDNGVMGTSAIAALANLDVNDSRWNAFLDKGVAFHSRLRPKIKEAASQVLKLSDLLLSYITGEDQIFSYQEMVNWLHENPVTLAMIRKGQLYYEFQNAMKILNMNDNLKMMDYLEWHYDHNKALPNNGRFGTLGMRLLSQLTVDSPLWEKRGIYRNHRKLEAINAAKIAMNPINDMLFLQTHGGDEIYDKDEIKKWLDWNR